MITKKEKRRPLGIFGNNILIGYYDIYAIVHDVEKEELFYFFMPEPLECMLFSSVEQELLKPLSEMPQEMQIKIKQKFLEA